MGNSHRPFYRVVVAKSSAGRDGAFIEVIGTCNPVAKPRRVEIKEDRALHWLMSGAQPTETVAYMLKEAGVLDKYFAERPAAKGKFKSLDKRTASMSQKSVVEPVPAAKVEATAAPEPAPEPAAAAPQPEETVQNSGTMATDEEAVEGPVTEAAETSAEQA